MAVSTRINVIKFKKREPLFNFYRKNEEKNFDDEADDDNDGDDDSNNGEECDVQILSHDNEVIMASSLILAASSKFMESVLISANFDTSDDLHIIHLRDFKSETIRLFLRFIHTGILNVDHQDEIQRVRELITLLRINGFHETSSSLKSNVKRDIKERLFHTKENEQEDEEEEEQEEDEEEEEGMEEGEDKQIIENGKKYPKSQEQLNNSRQQQSKRMGPSRKMWKCHLCNKKFWKLESIQAHLRIHQGLKPYKCELCGKEFKQESSYIEHKRLHADSSALTCEFCGKRFASSSGLKTHIEIIHVGVERKFTCEICQNKFKTKGALTVHMTSHAESKNFVCDTCGFQTTSKSLLHNHQFVHKKQKKYQCQMCDKSFNFKHSIDTHLRRHLGEKPFRCNQCEQGFCSNNQLKSHQKKVHTHHRNFVCKICAANFKTKQDATRHLILHSDAKPFQCTECGAPFKHREAGRRHIKSAHPGGKNISLHYVPTESLNELQSYALINVESTQSLGPPHHHHPPPPPPPPPPLQHPQQPPQQIPMTIQQQSHPHVVISSQHPLGMTHHILGLQH